MNSTRALILSLALALFAPILLAVSPPTARAANPGILRVTVSGATNGVCGDTWANPCDLQYALATLAQAGDELWVAAGTYKPTPGPDPIVSFGLRNDIALYGGFAGNETARDQRNHAANVTILSGDIGASGVISDNTYHVVTALWVTTTAVLDGFTVTGGIGLDFIRYEDGGGMYNYNSSPTLANVTFTGNSARHGAGMFNISSSSPTLTNVTFSGNSGSRDMSNWFDSNPTLINVTFSGSSGGGMDNHRNSNPTIRNTIFTGKSAPYGAGMLNDSSSPTLINVTFSGNSGSRDMSNWFDSNPTLINVTFSGSSGGGMDNYRNSNPTIRNSIVWGNSINNDLESTSYVSDSVVQGGCPLGSTCSNIITADPRLGPLGNWGGSTPTIPLLFGSSAIDAGNDAFCPPTDQRGVPRPQGAHCDIGAFEGQLLPLDLPLIKR